MLRAAALAVLLAASPAWGLVVAVPRAPMVTPPAARPISPGFRSAPAGPIRESRPAPAERPRSSSPPQKLTPPAANPDGSMPAFWWGWRPSAPASSPSR